MAPWSYAVSKHHVVSECRGYFETIFAKANKNSLDVSGKTSSVLFIIKIEVRTMWQSSH